MKNDSAMIVYIDGKDQCTAIHLETDGKPEKIAGEINSKCHSLHDINELAERQGSLLKFPKSNFPNIAHSHLYIKKDDNPAWFYRNNDHMHWPQKLDEVVSVIQHSKEDPANDANSLSQAGEAELNGTIYELVMAPGGDMLLYSREKSIYQPTNEPGDQQWGGTIEGLIDNLNKILEDKPGLLEDGDAVFFKDSLIAGAINGTFVNGDEATNIASANQMQEKRASTFSM